MDAQTACHELVLHYTDSRAAKKRSDHIFKQITAKTIPMTPLAQGSLEKQLIRFKDNIRQYNQLVIPDMAMDDATQLVHLKHFTSTVDELGVVSANADIWKQMSGVSITPRKYIELFESQAAEIDGKRKEAFLESRERLGREAL